MRTEREIEFAFNAASFAAALKNLQTSIDKKNGKLIEIKAGKTGGFDVGLIVVEEDV